MANWSAGAKAAHGFPDLTKKWGVRTAAMAVCRGETIIINLLSSPLQPALLPAIPPPSSGSHTQGAAASCLLHEFLSTAAPARQRPASARRRDTAHMPPPRGRRAAGLLRTRRLRAPRPARPEV
jgi:hypothetical protein